MILRHERKYNLGIEQTAVIIECHNDDGATIFLLVTVVVAEAEGASFGLFDEALCYLFACMKAKRSDTQIDKRYYVCVRGCCFIINTQL